MSKSIFIVVLVSYDWYRFQQNLYANNNQKDCIEWAKNYNKKENENLPIIRISKMSDNLDNRETGHLWIQEL